MALFDRDRDGRLDLVVANETSGEVSFLLGNGAGGFVPAPGSPRPAGTMPTDIAIADFDRDGQMDLAIANHETSLVTVLLARSGFDPAAASPFDTGGRPHVHSVAAGDLDGDGATDLVTESVDTDSVAVLFGDGRGGFEPARHFSTGRRPYFRLGAGDLDGDGRPEVVAPNSGDSTLTVLTADGRGGLVPASGSAIPVGRGPHSVAIGDVNEDGRADLAVLHFEDNRVSVFLGQGGWAFRPALGSPFPAGRDPTNLAFGDIDGDGVLDVAASNYSSDDVTLLLSDRQARPGAEVRRLGVGRRPLGLALGDLDGDGRADLVVADFLDNDVAVWLSHPPTAFMTSRPGDSRRSAIAPSPHEARQRDGRRPTNASGRIGSRLPHDGGKVHARENWMETWSGSSGSARVRAISQSVEQLPHEMHMSFLTGGRRS